MKLFNELIATAFISVALVVAVSLSLLAQLFFLPGKALDALADHLAGKPDIN